MPKVGDLQPMWVNPFEVDRSDPTNTNNPNNSMFYICESIHSAAIYLQTARAEEISEEEILQVTDFISRQAAILREKRLEDSNKSK